MKNLWFVDTNSILRGLLLAKPFHKVKFWFSETECLDFERFDKKSVYLMLNNSYFLELVFGNRFFYIKKDNRVIVKGSAHDLYEFFNIKFHQMHAEYRSKPVLDELPF